MLDHRLILILLRTEIMDAESELRPEESRFAWTNKPFTPPAPSAEDPDALWVEEKFFPGGDRQVASEIEMLEGVYQLNVHVAKDAGITKLMQTVKALADTMPPTTSVQSEDGRTELSIFRCEAGQGADGDARGGVAWWYIPLSFHFRAYQREGA